MKVLYFVCYVVTVTFYPGAWTLLTVGPNNVTAKVNQSVYMNCSTTSDSGIIWYLNGNTICAGLQCFDHYKERFRVENIASTKSWNLVISFVKTEDAGEYGCEEIGFESDQQSATLFVSVIKEKETTGNNSSDGLLYNSATSGAATSVTTDAATSGTNAGGKIAAAVICTIVGISVLIIIVCVVKKKNRRHSSRRQSNEGHRLTGNEDQQLMGDKVYLDRPILEKTIKTRVAEKKNVSIRAVSVFKKEVFVATQNCSEIEVYDVENLYLKRRFTIDGLINPFDIKSCLVNNCLYIVDCKRVGQQGKILKIDDEGNIQEEWPIEDSVARLSIASNGNLIVSLCANNKIVEYKSRGKKVRKIELVGPRHAILLQNGQFLVSQGYSDDDEWHKVVKLLLKKWTTRLKVGDDKRIVEAYGGEKGSTSGQLNVPWYMAVDENGYILVAERENQRVTLLSPTLKFEKILISDEDGLRQPLNMFMHISSNRLFVTDFKWDGNKRVDGRLLVFQIRKLSNTQV